MKNKRIIYLLTALTVFSISLSACSKDNGGGESEPEYNIVRPTFNGDFTTYALSSMPSGVNMTYYSDIYSRGFSWLTDNTVSDTKLYLVQSDQGEQADF